MKKQRHFTIIELLVAIAITTVVANLLATIYVRVTHISVKQVDRIGVTTQGYNVLKALESDFQRIALPIGAYDENAHTSRYLRIKADTFDKRLEDEDIPTYRMREVIDPADASRNGSGFRGHPGLIFTMKARQEEYGSLNNNSDYDGIVEVAYYLMPADKDDSFGEIDTNLFNLYRFIDNTNDLDSYNDTTEVYTGSGCTLFDDQTEHKVDSLDLVSKDFIYISFVFEQRARLDPFSQDFLDTGRFLTGADEHFYHFENENDYYPDAVRVTYTLAPPSGTVLMNYIHPTSTVINVDYSDYIDSGNEPTADGERDLTLGVEMSLDKFEVKNFAFEEEGFFADVTEGDIFYYHIKPGDPEYIYVFKVNGRSAAVLSSGGEYHVGHTFSRTFHLK